MRKLNQRVTPRPVNPGKRLLLSVTHPKSLLCLHHRPVANLFCLRWVSCNISWVLPLKCLVLQEILR